MQTSRVKLSGSSQWQLSSTCSSCVKPIIKQSLSIWKFIMSREVYQYAPVASIMDFLTWTQSQPSQEFKTYIMSTEQRQNVNYVGPLVSNMQVKTPSGSLTQRKAINTWIQKLSPVSGVGLQTELETEREMPHQIQRGSSRLLPESGCRSRKYLCQHALILPTAVRRKGRF